VFKSHGKRENLHLLIKINEHKVDVLIDMGAFMFVILINTIRELRLKGENMQNYIKKIVLANVLIKLCNK
jgi:hypothetical protein